MTQWFRIFGVSVVVALAWLVPVTAVLAGGARVVADVRPDEMRLRLEWEQLPAYTVETQGRELLLRFASPLGDTDFTKVYEQAQPWLSSVEGGYDSLLLRAAESATFDVITEGRAVIVSLHRVAGTTEEGEIAAEADADAERVKKRQHQREEILRARALFETGSYVEARVILQRLIDEDPALREGHLALAEVETRSGHWQSSNSLYSRVLAEVDDPAAARAKSQILYQQGQMLETRGTFVSVHNADQQWQSLTRGRIFLGRNSDAEFEYEARNIETPGKFIQPDGAVAPSGSFWRNRVEVRGQHETENELELGLKATSQLYDYGGSGSYGADNLGIGFSVASAVSEGTLAGSLTYHEPFWASVAGLLRGGAADRAGLKYHRMLGRRWTFDGASAANAYSMTQDRVEEATRTVSGSLAIRHLPAVTEGTLSLGYVLDTEQPWHIKKTTNALGQAYHPADLARREVHALELLYGRELLDYLSAEGSFSYAYDRFGGSGPGFSPSLIWRPVTPVEVGAQGSYVSISAVNGGANSATTSGLFFARLHF
ncbi:MAG: tetratricopeptide repeat protein [Alphaproteobacteria bacterium]